MNMNLFSYLIAKAPELAEKCWQQIYLAGSATLLATAIGIPLGIWAVKSRTVRPIILSTANLLQTVPSLALLALLIPLLGIGVLPALVTLSIYALLPIVTNTVVGITNIPSETNEAAKSLGFTRTQKLWLVELPLALPTIVAGIRIATAMSVGIATIAAFIGAGGLGDFIFQGISLGDNRLVLLGAIPAALLALGLDYLIGRIEKFIAEKKVRPFSPWRRRFIVGAILILMAGAIVGFSLTYRKNAPTIRVASKNFTEQYILGNLISDMITAKTNLKVEKKFNLGTTDVCQQAMLKGSIDIYPEYTGTALMTVLKLPVAADPSTVFDTVKSLYLKYFQIVWLPPFGFNNTQALAIPSDFALQHHIQNISDLVPYAPHLTIGVPAEFIQRADALPGLIKTYHLQFAHIRQMDPGLMYEAIHNHQVDVIMSFSTDGRIAKYQLQTLQDDKHLFPPYYAAPLIRQEVLNQYPKLANALAPLANLIDENTMQQLNYQVDVEKQTPETVARNFLQQKNLLQ